MKKNRIILPLLVIVLLFSAFQWGIFSQQNPGPTTHTATSTLLPTEGNLGGPTQPSANQAGSIPPVQIIPIATTTPFPHFFGCEMEMRFVSGPLEGKSSKFSVLSEDYFLDKGDLFHPGKNTAIYYDEPHYLILHSAFYNSNILKPLEAEFLRFYLEYWGDADSEYIQNKIDPLQGSEIDWYCNEQLLFQTKIKHAIRLSHEASNQLWLRPETLERILTNKEGLVSEWVGEMPLAEEPTFYLGFCGWGPRELGDERFYYFRYVLNFEILP